MATALLLVTGVAIADSVTCSPNTNPDDPSQEPCWGSSLDDTITGTLKLDYIIGLGGKDTINASYGDDTVYGDFEPKGEEVCSSDDNNDPSDNGDTIRGGYGDDAIEGGVGKDTIYGGYDDDTIDGCDGDDTIYGEWNRDVIDGGAGGDTLYGGINRDTITGGAGIDTIKGENDADTIDAADGEADFISCGTGTDTLKADAYADAYGKIIPIDKNLDDTPLTTAKSSCENIEWVIKAS
jgi:Ca2+-binding RTX toxin-like protein